MGDSTTPPAAAALLTPTIPPFTTIGLLSIPFSVNLSPSSGRRLAALRENNLTKRNAVILATEKSTERMKQLEREKEVQLLRDRRALLAQKSSLHASHTANLSQSKLFSLFQHYSSVQRVQEQNQAAARGEENLAAYRREQRNKERKLRAKQLAAEKLFFQQQRALREAELEAKWARRTEESGANFTQMLHSRAKMEEIILSTEKKIKLTNEAKVELSQSKKESQESKENAPEKAQIGFRKKRRDGETERSVIEEDRSPSSSAAVAPLPAAERLKVEPIQAPKEETPLNKPLRPKSAIRDDLEVPDLGDLDIDL
jgi:hypothetical protein